MFIAQAFRGKHEFWRYLIGSAIIFIAALVGQMPLLGALMVKAFRDGMPLNEINEEAMYSMLDSNLFLFLVLLSFLVGMLGLILVVEHLHKQTIRMVTTTRKKVDWKRIWFAFFFWGILSSGLVILDYYMSPENYVVNFNMERFAILAFIAIALIPVQTSLEEYLFRGYLMQGFGAGTKEKLFALGLILSLIFIPTLVFLNLQFDFGLIKNALTIVIMIVLSFGLHKLLEKSGALESEFYTNLSRKLERKWVPLVITSLIFGLLHIFNPEVQVLGYGIMVFYIGTGLFLGVITLMDEGLELALGFHAANNLFTALLVTADWTVFQTDSILKDIADPEMEFIDMVLPVFILFPILLFIFSKIYKWDNWKEKLFGHIQEPPAEDYKIIGMETAIPLEKIDE